MGEVYRARDTRLGREVAIKVLLQHLSSSPELKERFEREARAISSLNHPRICTLHDVGREGGIDFLVMEYLGGESLAERLRQGPLPLKQALKVGMEVCEANPAGSATRGFRRTEGRSPTRTIPRLAMMPVQLKWWISTASEP
jgi:serine/threonine protein kinase